ncbi:hypothetical protein Desaci_3474 [Desulfosporosinus acidiphilus SJ4]|uniref:Uncharacterized protein n=1 Tax=Desulfosporosinus acidiphilus (strain DSM 22704 / JCM 16185 / SJ4) TaxID=646529 RepID=I4D988_DESAJ|nr:hypothetical protein [Desulfosporosinus acidiphilus]AFM42362.1 hypothetical protein Desaci_3474 [Desulfosporosinus acidiphilus SJ4]
MLGFLQLVAFEILLLVSGGVIFFGGIRGTIAAMAVLSILNWGFHSLGPQFWHWEIPLFIGGAFGILSQFVLGKIAGKTHIVSGLVGGLVGLIFFGAFMTPVAAIILWILVIGMGLIPKNSNRNLLWSFAPAIFRIILCIGGIIFGNIMTL